MASDLSLKMLNDFSKRSVGAGNPLLPQLPPSSSVLTSGTANTAEMLQNRFLHMIENFKNRYSTSDLTCALSNQVLDALLKYLTTESSKVENFDNWFMNEHKKSMESQFESAIESAQASEVFKHKKIWQAEQREQQKQLEQQLQEQSKQLEELKKLNEQLQEQPKKRKKKNKESTDRKKNKKNRH